MSSSEETATRKQGNVAVVGLVSGAVSRLVASPFDVLKIRRQVSRSHTGVGEAVARIWAREGLAGFYRGNVPALGLWSMYSAIQLPVYEHLLSLVVSSRAACPTATEKAAASLVAGSGAAIVGTVATFPLDTLRTTVAIQDRAKGNIGLVTTTLGTVRASGGWRALYHGLGPSLLQVVPNVGLTFAFRSAVNDAFRAAGDPVAPVVQSLLGGFLAGSAAKMAIYPLDTVKRRLQVAGVTSLPEYKGRLAVLVPGTSVVKAVASIFSTEGVAGLYRGGGLAILKAGPSMAAYFAVYEALIGKSS